jgi:hypothetical protein
MRDEREPSRYGLRASEFFSSILGFLAEIRLRAKQPFRCRRAWFWGCLVS